MLPALIAAVDSGRTASAQRLTAAQATRPGETFTANGRTLRRAVTTRAPANIWAEDPADGRRRNLTREEDRAFWAWAAVEVLRLTGVRVEELTELTHPSLVQYRLPGTGELVPLLHIAPSKTDAERLLVVSPELADVLSAIICRARDETGAIPLVAAYDYHERVFNPPLPLLFQRRVGTENRAINAPAIRDLLDEALAASGAHRRPRAAAAVRPARLPPDLHHRRGDERHAPAHRPTRRRAPRPQHHHGVQGGLPARRPSTATEPSSPAAANCVPPGSTAPPPMRSGRSSSATSNAASSPSAIAAAPTEPRASTSTAASGARCCASTRPSGHDWWASATT